MNKFFDLRGTLDKKTALSAGVAGFLFLMSLWILLTWMKVVSPQLLPSPWKVICALGELHVKDALVRNMGYSIYLNVLGYVEAILIALIVGFLMGLLPLFKGLFSGYINASRFIPLTATTGLFIAWFGIDLNMKVQFLSFSIFLYLIPTVIQRVEEVDQVFEQTAITLGATPWQRLLHVYIPAVAARISDDIRVITAISWTYIVYCELVNAHAGVGYLVFLAQKQSRVDKTFAILFAIILVGFVQDQVFKFLDRKFFPYKYL